MGKLCVSLKQVWAQLGGTSTWLFDQWQLAVTLPNPSTKYANPFLTTLLEQLSLCPAHPERCHSG